MSGKFQYRSNNEKTFYFVGLYEYIVMLWFRSQVLYGALVSLDKHGFSSVHHHRGGGGAAASGQQEQHNLLALATSAGRFQLLPLGNQSRNVSAIMEAPKPRVRASHVC